MLLGQQAVPAVPTATGGINPAANGASPLEILVTDTKGSPVETEQDTYEDFSVRNVDAVKAVQSDVEATEETSDRKGMFGTKGTLRDILGLVGDAFLVQSGRSPMYAPAREQERISDAWAGASKDPVAAAVRVGHYDAGLGQELLQAAQADSLRQDQQESLVASREATIAEKQFKSYKQAREMIGGLLQTPGAVVNGQISPQALQQAERIAASANMTLEEFMIAEGMSEEDVRNYASSVMRPYDQRRLEDYDEGIRQRDFSNETGRINATRPRAAPRPRALTDRESDRRRPSRPNKVTVGGRTFTVKEN